MRASWRPFLSLGLGMALLWMCLVVIDGPMTAASQTVAEPTSLDGRGEDPVLVTGNQLYAFTGAPLDELALYAYGDSGWVPIPFQIDERTITGTIVITEDGLLDGDDELVFMARDAGEAATPSEWPVDIASRLQSRYAITVTDSLSPSQRAWAYLFRSATLPRAEEIYVTWDETAQTLTATSYTVSFEPDSFVGLAALTLNGSADILDRQKLYVNASVSFFQQEINEESPELLELLPAVTLQNVGPVRAVAGSESGGLFYGFYGGRFVLALNADLSDTVIDLPPFGAVPVHINTVRTSLDLRDPALSGFGPATYYDSNTSSGVPIDGAPDTVPLAPPSTWYQWAGAPGSLVTVLDVEPGAGLLTNVYRDDAAIDANDTGDQQRFGDTGMQIDAPDGGEIGFVSLLFNSLVYPPGQGNVGEAASARVHNPLLSQTAEQTFPGYQPVFLPFLNRD